MCGRGAASEYGGDARVEADESAADDADVEAVKVPGAARTVTATEVDSVVLERTVVDKESATEVPSSPTDKGMDSLEVHARNSSGVSPARMLSVLMTRMQRARRTNTREVAAQLRFDAQLLEGSDCGCAL